MLKILTFCAICGLSVTSANATDYPPDGSYIQVTRTQISQYTKMQIAKAIAYAKLHKITWTIIEDAQANTQITQK